MKLHILRLSALGDIAACVPAIRALRKKYPLKIITTTPGQALLEDEFDDFITLKGKNFFKTCELLWKLGYRKNNIIDFQSNDRSKLICYFTSKKTFNSNKISQLQPSSEIFYSIARKYDDSISLDVSFSPKEKSYIVLNCGSSPKWISKRLPLEKWREFSKVLHSRFNLPFLLTGDKNEQEYIEHVARHLTGNIEVVAGKTTIQELKYILRGAFLTVSTDSAPMHISAVEKTPTIGIFGPTNWIKSAPFGPWSSVLFDEKFYPKKIPPQKSQLEQKNYFDNILIEKGLFEIAPYLDL